MPTDHRAKLASIKRFDQLIAYLRDEMGWPIARDSFEDVDDLFYDFTADELGIDPKTAAKIQEIKRLRPLSPKQPWGIFFVKFEPKKLPVVALRRILSQVALKKRASANSAERAAWAADDLLFVSNYGEGETRQISFAHFSRARDGRDLPTLKVLGWNNLDTVLHLNAVARELTEHLAWPDDEADTEAWRTSWRAAFTLRHREVVTTSKELSIRLAELARSIRDRIQTALSIETDKGTLTKLMKDFQEALVHDLDADAFADMYAQTIAYGLLSARIADPYKKTADDFAAHMRTNPFLRELMETFLKVGGRRGKAGGPGIDFDELGVSEIVELLDDANMEAVVRDFGDRNPQEDPVIHFYELFLKEYDAKKRMQRGVFYTPRPVVSYIVRSVDELLRTEFGLADGLADTTTWGEMAKRHKDLKIPENVSPNQNFVQILDPATGTGTFLVEVIDRVHERLVAKWKTQGNSPRQIEALWNEYVPKHLLPRLHGYELLMAPYAIAHLKIGLKLYETGYRFRSAERARVYLTNALEPASSKQLTLGFLPALAHEAEQVNAIKRMQQFTVVIGNPPYLGESGTGGDWIAGLMRGCDITTGRKTSSYFEVDGSPLNERNSKWINDDYVKFIRLSHWLLEKTGYGIHGYISNHGYFDNPTFRGMRWSIMSTFDKIHAFDLHGNLKKKETAPEGGRDVNVFDIEQGVGIGLFVRSQHKREPLAVTTVQHADLWGDRPSKNDWLINHDLTNTEWRQVDAAEPFFLFEPLDSSEAGDYLVWPAIGEVMPVNGTGVITKRDSLSIHFTPDEVWTAVTAFSQMSEAEARAYFGLPPDVRDWRFDWAKKDVKSSGPSRSCIQPILYRPFDTRHIYYTGETRGFIGWPVFKVMGHMLAGENFAIVTARSNKFPEPDHFFASRTIVETKCGESSTQSATFPLYFYPGVGKSDAPMFSAWPEGTNGRRPNLDMGFVESIERPTGLVFQSDGRGDLRHSFGPEDVLAYIYAVFHCPDYRRRFEPMLKLDFPRIPPPATAAQFVALARLGSELLALHLFESPSLDKPITTYSGPKNPTVGRVGWSEGAVWIDAGKTNAREGHRATKSGTIGFKGLSEAVWDFHIGGYQVCYKWLKDRKGRTLSSEDIARYQKIVVALNETIRIMAEIDEVIEQHGGWPTTFQAGEAAAATASVIPLRPHIVDPKPEERYVTCVPLVPLKAAAGAFGDPQHVEDDGFEWVAVESRHRLRPGMFVAQVVGKSMEPAIPDGAYCLFSAPVEGTRQGKTVLMQLRDAKDTETGQRYTVKRYESNKVAKGDSWRHERITLKPLNPDFEPIILTRLDDGEMQTIAELVEVLGIDA